MSNQYSGLGPDDFQQAGLNLLPEGEAWPRDRDGVLAKVIGGLTDLLAMFHRDLSAVVDQELDPSRTVALLPEWETDYGLPDPCTPQPQTYEQRIAALVARRNDEGNLSIAKYIDLAAKLGFEITITEFRPMTCLGSCIDPLTDDSWRFVWQVNAPETTITDLTCLGNCVSPLRSWGNQPLECAIQRANRPSRTVIFSYGE